MRQQLEKDLLRNVMGGRLIAIEVVESDGIDAILIDLKQQAKSFGIAALARFDGSIVDGKIARHCADLHRVHISNSTVRRQPIAIPSICFDGSCSA
jgi:hypothetical protein